MLLPTYDILLGSFAYGGEYELKDVHVNGRRSYDELLEELALLSLPFQELYRTSALITRSILHNLSHKARGASGYSLRGHYATPLAKAHIEYDYSGS